MDGDDLRIILRETDLKSVRLSELIYIIVQGSCMENYANMHRQMIGKKLSPTVDSNIAAAKYAIKKCYEELDRREKEYLK